MNKVFIVGKDEDNKQYATMFESKGWEVVSQLRDANLVQFTGGDDIYPGLYKEPPHPQTQFNRQRDIIEVATFLACKKARIPMTGICRGAQLLNVLCGGKLWQHVNNHQKYSGHLVYDEIQNFSFKGVSLHHQMMRPAPDAFLVGVSRESTVKQGMTPSGYVTEMRNMSPFRDDTEVCVYWDPLCLCFQPHPEKAVVDTEAKEIYFYYLNEYLIDS